MRMITNAACIQVEEAVQGVNRGESDVILDFSSVSRIDSHVVGAMEELARLADEKKAKVVLRAVNVDIYRVLKILGLSRRFGFITG